MFIPKLKLSCEVVGQCAYIDGDIKIVSNDVLKQLEIAVSNSIREAYLFYDAISTLVIVLDDDTLDPEILEDQIGFVVRFRHDEIAYLQDLMSP